jgi:hypothetical protein
MNPRQLSHELRNGTSPNLNRRRWIVGLSMVGVAMGGIVSLYQTGILRRLPDPPTKAFDSNRVDVSNYAYSRFDTPDGLMMLTSSALTAWLAGAGGQNRARTQPELPVLMGLKLLLDVINNMRRVQEDWRAHKAMSMPNQLANLTSVAAALIAIPEVAAALNSLRRDDNEDYEDIVQDVREWLKEEEMAKSY